MFDCDVVLYPETFKTYHQMLVDCLDNIDCVVDSKIYDDNYITGIQLTLKKGYKKI